MFRYVVFAISRRVQPQASRGISLIELVLSLVILAISMIPIAGILTYGFAGTQRDQRTIAALQICQARLNQALTVPFSQLVTSNTSIASGGEILLPLGPVPDTPFTVTLTVVTPPSTRFTVQSVDVNAPGYQPNDPTTWVLIPPEDLNLPSKAKQIRMTVTWVEKGTPQNISLETYKCDLEH